MIQILDPERRRTVLLPEHIYYPLKDFMLRELNNSNGSITLDSLLNRAEQEISSLCNGDVSWFLLQVKIDLEGRNLIKVHRLKRPELVQLISLAPRKKSTIKKYFNSLSINNKP